MSISINIFSRCIVAIFGGYTISVLCSFALVPMLFTLLNSQLSDAVYYATMISYVVFFIVFILSFSVKNIWQLYTRLAIFSFLCIAIFFTQSTGMMP